ncbi:si:ch211-260e23.9 isoform X1 [Cyprinodon tularosa]|uniref:si:ch211-260e23.9 isoform X1 n=2 Tax=Cyprinodon tularosa TaxID=77115 RepID=UPI0018E26080|nr:si:ch211-260e23.9 isoform X1 [Cyprinodon tularosa]
MIPDACPPQYRLPLALPVRHDGSQVAKETPRMFGKLLSLLGNAAVDSGAVRDTELELLESEEEDWVIVDIPWDGATSAPDADPLENLLIEHPSMSVYQTRCRMGGAEGGEDLPSDEEEEEASRPVAVRRHVSWRLAAWGSPLPCGVQLLAAHRSRSLADRKKLSRSTLCRQNLAKTRFSAKDRRYGGLRCPSPRLFNY